MFEKVWDTAVKSHAGLAMVEWAVNIMYFLTRVWLWIVLSASIVTTVWCDPSGRSAREIPLLGSRRKIGSNRAFTVQADSAKNQRMVSWFYRWYREPTLADWMECCAILGLANPPNHMLNFIGGGGARVFVSINCESGTFAVSLASREPMVTRGGKYYLGDLTPASIVDIEKWSKLYA